MTITAKENEIVGGRISDDVELIALAAEMEAEWDALTPPVDWKEMGRMVRLRMMRVFLSTLFEPYRRVCAEEGYIEIRAIGNGFPVSYWILLTDYWRDEPHVSHALFQWADGANREGKDIYLGVLPRQKQSGKAEAIRYAAWIWADLDFKISEEAVFQGIRQFPVAPEMTILSGGGVHAYYEMEKGMDFTKSDSAQFRRKLTRVQKTLLPGGDVVADLPRILRVPGFRNTKRGAMVILATAPPQHFFKEFDCAN